MLGDLAYDEKCIAGFRFLKCANYVTLKTDCAVRRFVLEIRRMGVFMRSRILIALISIVLFLASNRSSAALIDIWDGTKGTVVTGGSATDDFFLPHNANLANMFIPKVNG